MLKTKQKNNNWDHSGPSMPLNVESLQFNHKKKVDWFYVVIFWKRRINLMIVPMEQRMFSQLTSIWNYCCSIRPKTLKSTLLNQNFIFPSLILFISTTVNYPCKVSCVTIQDRSDLLHSTFLFLQPSLADYSNCEVLSGVKLLLERFLHVSHFISSVFAKFLAEPTLLQR